MESKIYLALYKGNRSGTGFEVWKSRLGDWLTRKLTRGKYSHCEITDLVMTGKADFKSLATSIISDISQMIVKMMLFNAIKQGMSAMGFSFSGGGEVGQHYKGGLVGFDDGGFTGLGGNYTPAGIVHKGEYVLTKEATSRIGLNYLNYLNYGTTRGFANGGVVGNVTGYAKSVQSGTTGNVSVKVINNGEPAQADVSTKQNGNQLEITVELMRNIAKTEAIDILPALKDGDSY